jgi:hypothetical protein
VLLGCYSTLIFIFTVRRLNESNFQL